jgi:hypothetical protein
MLSKGLWPGANDIAEVGGLERELFVAAEEPLDETESVGECEWFPFASDSERIACSCKNRWAGTGGAFSSRESLRSLTTLADNGALKS